MEVVMSMESSERALSSHRVREKVNATTGVCCRWDRKCRRYQVHLPDPLAELHGVRHGGAEENDADVIGKHDQNLFPHDPPLRGEKRGDGYSRLQQGGGNPIGERCGELSGASLTSASLM
ncbi:hypothetical protein EYF80_030101 [Liparis tanakae]|uniref:Uncharacterized protein n=1 Tax=Liparis tanakae TaxID=230148 RepID=A0A4Z2H2P4_9TELE|nr:hypothetical protein EYF80_030101 [Liparis tanakae]